MMPDLDAPFLYRVPAIIFWSLALVVYVGFLCAALPLVIICSLHWTSGR